MIAGHERSADWGMRRDDAARDEVGWVAVAPSWGCITRELWGAVEDWWVLEQIWAWKEALLAT